MKAPKYHIPQRRKMRPTQERARRRAKFLAHHIDLFIDMIKVGPVTPEKASIMVTGCTFKSLMIDFGKRGKL